MLLQTKKKRLPPLSAPTATGAAGSLGQTGYANLSLRQSVHYNTVRDAKVLEERVERSQVGYPGCA